MQLAAFTSDHFPLGQAAMQVNEGLPAYIVSALERRYGGLQGKTVGILGMAFKGESDDTRASLSYKLRKLLSWAGARVLATDPYVRTTGSSPSTASLAESDVLVLGAPHRAYRGLEIGGKDVIDVWGAARRRDPPVSADSGPWPAGLASHRRRTRAGARAGLRPDSGRRWGPLLDGGGLALITGIALAIGIAYAVANIVPVDTDMYWRAGLSTHYYGTVWAARRELPLRLSAAARPGDRAAGADRLVRVRHRLDRLRLRRHVGEHPPLEPLVVLAATAAAAILWGIDSGPAKPLLLAMIGNVQPLLRRRSSSASGGPRRGPSSS